MLFPFRTSGNAMAVVAFLTLSTLGVLPAADACETSHSELVGVGTTGAGIYERDKWSTTSSDCQWGSWEEECTSTAVEGGSTPSSITIPEIRVAGQVVVPQTTVPLPSESWPSVRAPDRPAESQCGVTSHDYGVYIQVEGWYALYVGTDGCTPHDHLPCNLLP